MSQLFFGKTVFYVKKKFPIEPDCIGNGTNPEIFFYGFFPKIKFSISHKKIEIQSEN
jgi:hypothetical protein